jgi:hypothetical protein
MTAEQFTYWLQGFIETADPKSINEKQTQIIKDHLKLVFTKVTQDYPYIPPQDFGTIKPLDFNPTPVWYTNPINPIPGTIC